MSCESDTGNSRPASPTPHHSSAPGPEDDSDSDSDDDLPLGAATNATGLLGSRVRKHFLGHGWFTGRVVDVIEAAGEVGNVRVLYEDGDTELMNFVQVRELIV